MCQATTAEQLSRNLQQSPRESQVPERLGEILPRLLLQRGISPKSEFFEGSATSIPCPAEALLELEEEEALV